MFHLKILCVLISGKSLSQCVSASILVKSQTDLNASMSKTGTNNWSEATFTFISAVKDKQRKWGIKPSTRKKLPPCWGCGRYRLSQFLDLVTTTRVKPTPRPFIRHRKWQTYLCRLLFIKLKKCHNRVLLKSRRALLQIRSQLKGTFRQHTTPTDMKESSNKVKCSILATLVWSYNTPKATAPGSALRSHPGHFRHMQNCWMATGRVVRNKRKSRSWLNKKVCLQESVFKIKSNF